MVQAVKRRQAVVSNVQQLLAGIGFIRYQKQIPNVDRLSRYMEREHDVKQTEVEKHLHLAVLDNLVHSYTGVGFKGSKTGVEYEGFRVPESDEIEVDDDGHDWYCFECHGPGEMYTCSDCWRVFHPACQNEDTSDSKYLCAICKSGRKKKKTKRKLLNTLLSYTIVRLKEKTRELHRIGHREEEKKFMPLFVYKPMDLNKMEQKVMAHKYKSIEEFLADAHCVLHNIVLMYGEDSLNGMTDLARVMIKDCKYDIDEMAQCQNCYYMSNAKPRSWFAQPCDPSHELVYAKLKGFSYWPAKVIRYIDDEKYDVRFFGGFHQRALILKEQIKPIDTSHKQLKPKKTGGFIKAEVELALHRKLVKEREEMQEEEEEEEENTEENVAEDVEVQEKQDQEKPRKKKRKLDTEELEMHKKFTKDDTEVDEREVDNGEVEENGVREKVRSKKRKKDKLDTEELEMHKKFNKDDTEVDEREVDNGEVEENGVREKVRSKKRKKDREEEKEMDTETVTSTSTYSRKSKSKKVASPEDVSVVTSSEEYVPPTKVPRVVCTNTASQTQRKFTHNPIKVTYVQTDPIELSDIKNPSDPFDTIQSSASDTSAVSDKTVISEKTKSDKIDSLPKSEKSDTASESGESVSSETLSKSDSTEKSTSVKKIEMDVKSDSESVKEVLPPVPIKCDCETKYKKIQQDMKSKMEKEFKDVKQMALEELSERLQKDFEEDKQLAVSRAMGKLQSELDRVRRQTEDKCKEQYKEEMKKLAQKHKETISHTKKKQWCYNCEEEAMYHCCWNTSYCSVKCQQEHWHKEHKRVCRRKR